MNWRPLNNSCLELTIGTKDQRFCKTPCALSGCPSTGRSVGLSGMRLRREGFPGVFSHGRFVAPRQALAAWREVGSCEKCDTHAAYCGEKDDFDSRKKDISRRVRALRAWDSSGKATALLWKDLVLSLCRDWQAPSCFHLSEFLEPKGAVNCKRVNNGSSLALQAFSWLCFGVQLAYEGHTWTGRKKGGGFIPRVAR